MTTWMPIPEDVDPSHAPFDGKPVLVANYAHSTEAYYYHDADSHMHDGWYQAGGHWTDAHDTQVFPIVWQPMPAPPTR